MSYFEWVQDRAGYFWDEETVNRRLETIMVRSFRDVAALSEKRKVTMRIAAYMVAVDRVAIAHRESSSMRSAPRAASRRRSRSSPEGIARFIAGTASGHAEPRRPKMTGARASRLRRHASPARRGR